MCNGVDLEFYFQIGERSRHRAHTGEGTLALTFRKIWMSAEQLRHTTQFLVTGHRRGQELAGATAIEGREPAEIFGLQEPPSCLDLGDGGSGHTKLRRDLSLGETACPPCFLEHTSDIMRSSVHRSWCLSALPREDFLIESSATVNNVRYSNIISEATWTISHV